MSSQTPPAETPVENHTPKKTGVLLGRFLAWLVILAGCGLLVAAFLPSDSPYALSHFLWYADFRFWPEWASTCCWLAFVWGVLSFIFAILIPKNKDRLLVIRRSFYQKTFALLFIILIGLVWYSFSTLPLATVFSPLVSPFVDYVCRHYTLPLADYYTTGEGANPLFWPIVGVTVLIILFLTWRIWFYVKRWKKGRTIVALLLIVIMPMMLGADEPVSTQPKKVETSIGIYDVQSKEDIDKFTVEETRELVKMEDNRSKGAGLWPHPVLAYCFEERAFTYSGGKYESAEIKYRLHVPRKIVPGKKYPLVVHLHGIGEAGDNTPMSLAHLHSILPLMTGPEQQDFYLLVTQCPAADRRWTFSPAKDGNLDVAVAAINHIVSENSIDENRLSVFGLSSGGSGVWRLLSEYPEKFAAAVPTSCGGGNDFQKLTTLTNTAIWTFRNKGDGNAPLESNREAMRIINGSGGYMKLTQFDQGGHAAWRPAMDEYNCFAWMIAQKRGGWFNPPPERKVYQGRSLSNCFFSFFLPLGLAAGLFVFQRTALCERLHERIADRLYHREDDDDDEEDKDDGFRILSDVTGTKKIKTKIVGFQGDAIKIESPEGKITTAAIKHFSEADQKMLRKMQAEQPLPEGFRQWTNFNGAQTFVAKFVGFQGNGMVLLQSQAGKTIPVPVDQLGRAEQNFLARQREQTATEPLPEGFRQWTNFNGTQTFVAKFIGFDGDDQVVLQSKAGKSMSVPINQLGRAEQEYLQTLREEPPSN